MALSTPLLLAWCDRIVQSQPVWYECSKSSILCSDTPGQCWAKAIVPDSFHGHDFTDATNFIKMSRGEKKKEIQLVIVIYTNTSLPPSHPHTHTEFRRTHLVQSSFSVHRSSVLCELCVLCPEGSAQCGAPSMLDHTLDSSQNSLLQAATSYKMRRRNNYIICILEAALITFQTRCDHNNASFLPECGHFK